MQNYSQTPVGQIVAKDYRTAQILRSHGLDFCCGGGRTLEKACASKNIELEQVISELEGLQTSDSLTENYNEWSLDFLVDYIVNNHHGFVQKALPEINFYAEKVARVHGERNPNLYDILQKVRLLSDEMLGHLQKEEEDLFPQIKELVREHKKGSVKEALIEALEDEHDKAGQLMAEIEELTEGFTPPEDACASYRVLFQNLEGFQQDLHKHVHLENNILFPKALNLEQRLN
ncbi:iron-sulfur cluster repair di-iron protein [Gracilimonas mengyeensis]|uniref:Regulator of cell morphogenesis and NO signaling n=1 Tax=Gracilimonas mengyeensis TaxID=1302730 RepID=A0A521C557_9BACT|nr:iron-sulfur cluster repair di-iron protein [Gracilimonas mengyeensis]SMO54647.1 regulator of cell morphogenesis and NO signaling [Gracilimonas mengyeensis]